MNTLYIGIDLSLKKNQIVIIDEEGKQLANFSVANNVPGSEQLCDKIILLGKQRGITRIKIGMEATCLFWWHVRQFLSEHKKLNTVFDSVTVYTINPKQVKRFHKSYPDLDKTDPVDAFVIADQVRFGRLNTSHMIDEQYEPLKRLTRFRYHMIRQLIVEENYLFNHLFLKYSSWQSVKPFSDPFRVTAESVITEYDQEELMGMEMQTLMERIVSLSCNRIADPKKTAALLKEVAISSYSLKQGFREPINIILRNTYDNISYFMLKIRSIDQVIEKEFKRYPNTLMSIPGIGLVFAAGITAEIGNLSRFTNQSQVAKFAGLAWKRNQSGEAEFEETPRKPGNNYLRYYLVQAANSLRVHNEAYKTYYEKKFKEVPKHQHKRALVLSARKLVRLCVAMLRDQKLYQTNRERKE